MGHPGRRDSDVWARAPQRADLCLEPCLSRFRSSESTRRRRCFFGRRSLHGPARSGRTTNARSPQRATLSTWLFSLEEYAEAGILGRGILEKQRRVLGRDHFDTLATSANLASSLSRQGKHADAAEIERELLVSRTRLLGAEHERTLMSVGNLSVSLYKCDQKTEAEPLFRSTLALSLCARPARPTKLRSVCLTSSARSVSQRDERPRCTTGFSRWAAFL